MITLKYKVQHKNLYSVFAHEMKGKNNWLDDSVNIHCMYCCTISVEISKVELLVMYQWHIAFERYVLNMQSSSFGEVPSRCCKLVLLTFNDKDGRSRIENYKAGDAEIMFVDLHSIP